MKELWKTFGEEGKQDPNWIVENMVSCYASGVPILSNYLLVVDEKEFGYCPTYRSSRNALMTRA